MKTNIGVFFGGRSTEHEISVISASQAMHAIDRSRYDVTPVYITKNGHWHTGQALLDIANYRDLPSLLAKTEEVYMAPVLGDFNIYRRKKKLFGSQTVTRIDVAIPVFHGNGGEDGVFQGIFESVGIPYAGCGVMSSAVGMDKIMMKLALKSCGIPVIDFVWFTDKQWFANQHELTEKIESQLGYPVIVKPSDLGSSVGIGTATSREELAQRVDTAQTYSSRILVEKLVENLQEINCSVLGDCDECSASILEEPIKSGDILSYEDKYMGGSKGAKGMQASAKRIPADLPQAETERIQQLATKTFQALSCHGVSRVDVIIDRDTRDIFVNEINTIPGSLSFYLWEASGVTFPDLMDRLVKLALKRKREDSMKTESYDHNIFSLQAGIKGAKGPKLG